MHHDAMRLSRDRFDFDFTRRKCTRENVTQTIWNFRDSPCTFAGTEFRDEEVYQKIFDKKDGESARVSFNVRAYSRLGQAMCYRKPNALYRYSTF